MQAKSVRAQPPLPLASLLLFALATLLLPLHGCAVVYYAGMPLVYDKAESDSITEYVDERYFDGPTELDDKTRLDLFFPGGEDWPILVFAHGGGWTSGDKDLHIGGRDVYRNIGRYYASHGIGVAVINYRLLPGVHWRTQLRDVGRAVLYTRSRAAEAGADTTRLFLSGHSAGAQLVSRVALDNLILAELNASTDVVCGVIGVSGAGYDLEDPETFALGAKPEYLETRYGRVDGTSTWSHDASVLHFVDKDSPPFLLIHGEDEHPGFIRQTKLMAERLKEAGVPVDTVVVDGYTHPRMVLALSREDREAGPAIVAFVKGTTCGTR